jgi:hypothetical protein
MVVNVQYFEEFQHRYIIDCGFDIVNSSFELVVIGNLAIGNWRKHNSRIRENVCFGSDIWKVEKKESKVSSEKTIGELKENILRTVKSMLVAIYCYNWLGKKNTVVMKIVFS